ncbi:hypothetical protein M6B38_311140 [Iris pallida]|uniref:Uncharacterized protein n=1 Tax=Iris pallida TaxID=29817 RepID=A0AAX6HFU0_IRIPA|nr:hypothetical protein M6B38_311140 [Iris pallida]
MYLAWIKKVFFRLFPDLVYLGIDLFIFLFKCVPHCSTHRLYRTMLYVTESPSSESVTLGGTTN